MPFSMLQAALGLSFALLWLFIGGMMMADRLAEVRRRRWLSGSPVAANPAARPHTLSRSPSKRRASRVRDF